MALIGIVGAGRIAQSFSVAAIGAGHDVVIANSRPPETIARLVDALGPHASAATTREVAKTGDFVVLAIPLFALQRVPVEPLSGKIIITPCNYLPERDGQYPELELGTLTVPRLLQNYLPSSRVVRAFNHIKAADIIDDARPPAAPNRRALAYNADDREAGELVARLYTQFGFDPVDAAGLDAAWQLDIHQPTFVVRLTVDELRENLANAQLAIAS